MNELLCKISEVVSQLEAVTQMNAKGTLGYGQPRNVLCAGLFTAVWRMW